MSNIQYDVQSLFENLLHIDITLPSNIQTAVEKVVECGEKQKGVLTVVVTGLVYKYYHPEQDVRKHQSNMMNGYSGRTFDTKYITPFMRNNNFPAMAESGWLTRSLEQNLPYTTGYRGKISGKGLKEAFLSLYEYIENYPAPENILACLFQKLVEKRDQNKIKLFIPANLTVEETHILIKKHFEYKYKNVTGASRLPSLAIYAVYKAIIEGNQARYKDKILCEINSHTASDKSTGSIGDIQINDKYGNPFEGIEIKSKQITSDMLDILYLKIHEYTTVERYYILSTKDIKKATDTEIYNKIKGIRSKHGCDVIVNGVYSTLKYLLRLIDNKKFLKHYVTKVTEDKSLKYEHRKVWNDLCVDLNI